MKYRCNKCGTEFESGMSVRCPNCGEAMDVEPVRRRATKPAP